MISEHRKQLTLDIVLYLYSQTAFVSFNELHRRFYRRFKNGKSELESILQSLIDLKMGILLESKNKGKLEYFAVKENVVRWLSSLKNSTTSLEDEFKPISRKAEILNDKTYEGGITDALKEDKLQVSNVLGLKPTEIPDFEGEI